MLCDVGKADWVRGQTEKNQMDLMGLKDVVDSKSTMTEEEFEVSPCAPCCIGRSLMRVLVGCAAAHGVPVGTRVDAGFEGSGEESQGGAASCRGSRR